MTGESKSLQLGRDALERHEWDDAYRLLSQADAEGALTAGDELEDLADAASWARRHDAMVEARERAYTAHLTAGNNRRAAYIAMLIARDYGDQQRAAAQAGWRARAERLLEGEPEGAEHGQLALRKASQALGACDYEHALERASLAIEICRRHGDRDGEMMAMHIQGRVLVAQGSLAEGMALIDEATAAAVGGELSAYSTGLVYCWTIATCREFTDFVRAGEWTEAAGRWCDRNAITGFPGVCRIHRAELLRLRGAWAKAAVDAVHATEELIGHNAMRGAAFNELGEIRLRMGELDGAAEAFQQAHALGSECEPGQSLLLAARGELAAAAAALARELGDAPAARLTRARLLPAQVEIALAVGDLETASAAAEELQGLAITYPTTALKAYSSAAKGAVLVAQRQFGPAVSALRQALHGWQELDAPYEASQVRILLAQSYAGLGDQPAAVLEAGAARRAFESLGAKLDLRRAVQLESGLKPAAALEVRRTFMFTDMVRSTSLVEAIGDEAWAQLVAWHDQALRAKFDAHDGEEVDHAGDGFFVVFADAAAAFACAIAIQRMLAEHRGSHGFAPSVRIGLHSDSARSVAKGYRGKGVNQAARLAALAEAHQIVCSAQTASAGSAVTVFDEREVHLKGMSRAVQVVTVDWR